MSSSAFPFRERLLRLGTREARDDGLSPVFSCGPPGGVSGSSFSIALGVACSLVSPSLLSSTGARTFASETEKEENRARLCRTKKHLLDRSSTMFSSSSPFEERKEHGPRQRFHLFFHPNVLIRPSGSQGAARGFDLDLSFSFPRKREERSLSRRSPSSTPRKERQEDAVA
uniref:Uncharacterized protein n=1 Tax=Picocystis salinarum TaxID=88271 RepID=A0A6U9RTS3_9CHLO